LVAANLDLSAEFIQAYVHTSHGTVVRKPRQGLLGWRGEVYGSVARRVPLLACPAVL
jgi:hypothetical protein